MPPPSPTSPGLFGFSVPGTPVSPAFSAATVVGVRLPLPIVRAALQGDHETILSWLANSMNDIDATWSSPDRHYRGYTLLMLATQAMDEPLVDALIRRECSLDHQDANKGLTALMMAVQRGRPTLVSPWMACALVNRGASAKFRTGTGNSLRRFNLDIRNFAILVRESSVHVPVQ